METADGKRVVGAAGGWPPWAKGLASAAIAVHGLAVLAAALAGSPASALQDGAADLFIPYYQAIDQGYTYRYYAPEPPPTPVVTAKVEYDDGRPTAEIRLPDRSARPRLRYQRQLALAHHLHNDFLKARSAPESPPSLWARSYARHLSLAHPGAARVSLYVQMHRTPTLGELAEAADHGHPIDPDADPFWTVPERIGEYPCDAF